MGKVVKVGIIGFGTVGAGKNYSQKNKKTNK